MDLILNRFFRSIPAVLIAATLALGCGAAVHAQDGTSAKSTTDNDKSQAKGNQTSEVAAPQSSSQPSQSSKPQTDTEQPVVLTVTSVQVVHGAYDCSRAIANAYALRRNFQRSPPAEPKERELAGKRIEEKAQNLLAACEKGLAKDGGPSRQVLAGAGDVVVSVLADAYEAARTYQNRGARQLSVFFNGFNVTDDADAEASDMIGDHVFIRYHLKPGKQANPMWAAMIRTGGMRAEPRLHVSFGWDNTVPNSVESDLFYSKARIAVTDGWHLFAAIVVLAILLIVGLLFGTRTSVLRNTIPRPIADLLPAARMLKQAMTGLDETKRDAYVRQAYPGTTGTTAAIALEQVMRDPVMLDKQPANDVVAGLALLPAADLTQALSRRMSFSLARVQLFCWFMFALLAGVFLWLIYSELPPLDNSMLALLGISAGTAGLSWAVDKNQDTTGTLSQGLLFDLVTGTDNEHKIYRFQAVLVNLVLLAVGIGHIITSVAYPLFDESWLIFLGISGTTFVGGKELSKPST